MQEEPATLPIGAVIRKRYIVEGLLGRGGSDAVYLVRDQRVRYAKDNLFVLKQIKGPSQQERYRLTFDDALLKRLYHHGLPRVHRVFSDDTHDRVYMVMEYIEGPNLEMLRQQQPEKRFSYLEAMNFMAPIVDAVGYLHRQQPPMIHRDIKPTDIIVPKTGARAVLVDFGIDKKYGPVSTSGMVHFYAPNYKAPELYSGDGDIRTDIYGLGATFYTLVTGIVPADARSRMTQSGSTGTDPLEPVNKLVPTVPMRIGKAIDRAISLDPHRRFSSVEQFLEELWSLVEHPVSMSGMPSVLADPPAVSVPTPEPEGAVEHDAAAMLLPEPPPVVSMADSAKEPEDLDATEPLPKLPPVVPMPDTLKEQEALDTTKSLSEPPLVVPMPDTLKEQKDLDAAKPLPEPPPVVLMSTSIKEQEDLDDVMLSPKPPSVVSMAESAKEPEDLEAIEPLPEPPPVVPMPDAVEEREGPDTTKLPPIVPMPDTLKEQEDLDAAKPLLEPPLVVPVPDTLKEQEDLDAAKPLPEPPLVVPVLDALKEQEDLDAAKPLPEPPQIVPVPDALKEQEDLDDVMLLPKPPSVVSMADSAKEPEDLEATLRLLKPPVVSISEDIKEQEGPAVAQHWPEPARVVPVFAGVKGHESPDIPKLLSRLPRVVQPPISLRKLGVLFIILTVLISLGIGAAFLSRAQSHPTARSTIPAPTTTAPAPTPPATAVSSRYPRLAGAYIGTIYDLSDNVQTSMFLAGMQQTQGSFTGRLILGPGMKSGGLFKGTINMAKYLQFTVMDAAGNATLFFEGAVQSATSLSGDYYQCSPGPVQGSSCSRIPGSYGLWNVLVAPSGHSSPPSQSDFAEISRSQQGNYGRRLDSDISSS